MTGENKRMKLDHTREGGNVSEGLLWHQRLGHPSLGYLNILKQNVLELQKVKFEYDIKNCEACIQAKMHQLPSTSVRHCTSIPCHIVHSDLLGKISPKSYRNGKCYVVTFIDDATCFALAYTMKRKCEVGICFEKYLIEI